MSAKWSFNGIIELEIVIKISDLFYYFIDFLAGIGKKLYICSRNWRKNLPIELEYGIYIS